MKSRIYTSEKLDNKDFRFGQTTSYFPAIVVDTNDEEHKALFTYDQLQRARIRAKRNQEDFPVSKLHYQINPCDMDRFKFLAPIGDALAAIYEGFNAGTECVCCRGARLVALAVLSFTLGAVLL
jgi:hypothetical protein